MSLSLGEIRSNVRTIEFEQFDEASFDPNIPLVVRGSAARATRKWTEAWSIQRFSDGLCQVSMDSRPAMRSFERQMPVPSYFDELKRPDLSGSPPSYLVHSERDSIGAGNVLEDLDVPAAISALGRPNLYRFFVGPADTGTLPHYHTYAINALARGRKRWAIYVGVDRDHTDRILASSYRRYGAGSQAREWFAQECTQLRSRNVRLWEFIQEPGDLVYIPAFAIHAVINLELVTGFTVEFQPVHVRHAPDGAFLLGVSQRVPLSALPPLGSQPPRRRPWGASGPAPQRLEQRTR